MPQKYTLIQKTTFLSFKELETPLALLIHRQKITKSQYAAIISLCSGAYPCDVSIEQRTPKELIYVAVNDQKYTINNRARICIKS